MMPSKSNATLSSFGWGSMQGLLSLSVMMRPAGIPCRASSRTSLRLAERNRSTLNVLMTSAGDSPERKMHVSMGSP